MFKLTEKQFSKLIRNQRPDLHDEFMELDILNGEPLFIEYKGTLLSLRLRKEQKLIWIMGVLGQGLEWLWELQKYGLFNGYEWLGFKVKKGLPWGSSIVRFSKARLMAETPSGDEYCASMRAR